MRELRRLGLVAAAFGLGLGISACFSGSGTLGNYCEVSTDCGGEQSCENGICGRCGNGELDEGELCYGPATDYFVGGTAARMIPVDVDEDGALDVVAAVNGECGPMDCWILAFLINDGEGDFTVAYDQGMEFSPGRVEGIEFGDFDGDGTADTIIALGNDPTLQVILDVNSENGGGFFVELPHPPRTVVIADFNGDDIDDAAVGSDTPEADNVTVLLGDGTGSFQIEESYDVGAVTRLAVPRDLDGDGEFDLVVTSAGTAEVVVLSGDGDGGFDETDRRAFPEGTWPIHAVASDVTLDGLLDVIVALPAPPNAPTPNNLIALIAGTPNGLADEPLYLGVGDDPVYIEVGDVNADGLDDLLVANSSEDKISFFINRDGEVPDAQVLDASFGPKAIIREDFNGDGVADLLVSYQSGVISLSPSRI